MVYGYPRIDLESDFAYMLKKESLRQRVRGLDFEEAKKVVAEAIDGQDARGWCDAAVPRVEDHYTVPQMVEMMKEAGFVNVRRLEPQMRNILVVG